MLGAQPWNLLDAQRYLEKLCGQNEQCVTHGFVPEPPPLHFVHEHKLRPIGNPDFAALQDDSSTSARLIKIAAAPCSGLIQIKRKVALPAGPVLKRPAAAAAALLPHGDAACVGEAAGPEEDAAAELIEDFTISTIYACVMAATMIMAATMLMGNHLPSAAGPLDSRRPGLNQPTNQPTNPPTNQPTASQPTNQLNQPINQSSTWCWLWRWVGVERTMYTCVYIYIYMFSDSICLEEPDPAALATAVGPEPAAGAEPARAVGPELALVAAAVAGPAAEPAAAAVGPTRRFGCPRCRWGPQGKGCDTCRYWADHGLKGYSRGPNNEVMAPR